MSKKKKRANSQRKNEITKGIFTVLESNPNKSFNYKQIAAKLEIVDTQGRNELIKRLGQLKQKQRIVEVDRGSYKKKQEIKTLLEGVVDMTSSGNAYVVVNELDDDIFVAAHKVNKAFHGDTVQVFVNPRRKGKKLEGQIEKVLKRKKEEYVGIVDKQKTYAFIRPMDQRMYTDIFVPQEKMQKAQNGDKVLVKLGDWPADADSPYGTIIKVLGKPGEHNTEIHSILAEYGLPYEFPHEVEEFCKKVGYLNTTKGN